MNLKEKAAISKFFCFHVKELDNLSIEEIQKITSEYFFEMTGKQWAVPNEVVEKLIKLRRAELQV